MLRLSSRASFVISSFGILAVVSLAQAATLKADYLFDNNLDSSVQPAPALVAETAMGGSNSYSQDTVGTSQKTVYNFAGSGFSLETDGLIANDNYSVVITAKFSSLTGYGKLLDFQDLTQDQGLYNNSGVLDYFDGLNDHLGSTVPGLAAADGYVQIAFTRNSSNNLVTAYVDGQSAFSFTDSTALTTITDSTSTTGQQFLNILFDDNADILPLTPEDDAGSVSEIQIYDGALTPTEVATLFTSMPEPASLMMIGLGTLVALRRRR
jgi:hypothetical protein